VQYLLPCMVSIKCFNQILTLISDIFSSKFSQDSDQKELGVKYTTQRVFWGKNMQTPLYFEGKKSDVV
jgi:hypothetical protein